MATVADNKGTRHYKHQWLSAVAKAKDLDLDVRGLLFAIGEEIMQPDGMNVWASQGHIAKVCLGDGESKRKVVNRLLGEAVEAGFIRYEMRADSRGEVRRHLTPVIPVPESGHTSVPESGHKPTGEEPTQLNPDKAPTGEGPGARIPKSKRGPKRVGGLANDESVLLEPDAESEYRQERIEFATVALARDALSRDEDERREQVRRWTGRPAVDADALLAALAGTETHEWEVGWRGDLLRIVTLADRLRLDGRFTGSHAVEMLTHAETRFPDPENRLDALLQAIEWSEPSVVARPVEFLVARLNKVAKGRADLCA